MTISRLLWLTLRASKGKWQPDLTESYVVPIPEILQPCDIRVRAVVGVVVMVVVLCMAITLSLLSSPLPLILLLWNNLFFVVCRCRPLW